MNETTEAEETKKRKADAITPDGETSVDDVALEAPVTITGGDAGPVVLLAAPAIDDQQSKSSPNNEQAQPDDMQVDVNLKPLDKISSEASPAQEEKEEVPNIITGTIETDEAVIPIANNNSMTDDAITILAGTANKPSEDKDGSLKSSEEILEVSANTREEKEKANNEGEAADPAAEDSAPPLSADPPQQDEAAPSTANEDMAFNNITSQSDGLVNEYSDPSYKTVRYAIIENDGSPAALIKLVGLKSLFAKQLPKMPRAYIARLVFDRRHVSLAILSSDPTVRDSDEEIIGAICYRPFHEQRFAEIAFCAVNGNHQVKGYGTKLMILLKQHAARDGIEYFITYADNFAIGYFKKQGFTKSITMPKGRYHGLIKDYDGGTPMECYIHPSIDFTRIDEMVDAQRKFILNRIAVTAKSATAVYPPIRKLHVEESPLARSNPSIARALSIPGVAEAGWTVADLMPDASNGRDGSISAAALKTELLDAIRKISEQQYAWPFREPVNVEEVPDYLDVIKNPIDLKTMERKAKQDAYKNKQMLFNDVMLMCDNCRVFNEDGSQYTQCANKVERYTRNLLPDCTRKTPKK